MEKIILFKNEFFSKIFLPKKRKNDVFGGVLIKKIFFRKNVGPGAKNHQKNRKMKKIAHQCRWPIFWLAPLKRPLFTLFNHQKTSHPAKVIFIIQRS